MKLPTFLVLLAVAASAEEKRGDAPDAPPSTPEQERAMFHLPPGFEIQLVASEPQIQKPMNLAFDAAGRLWVTGSEMYPWPAKVDALGQPIAGFEETWTSMSGAFDPKLAPQPSERATDTVRVLSDFAPDGRARKITVFADGLNIPIGIQPLPRKHPQISQISADGKAADSSSKNLRQSAKSADPKGDSVIVFSIPKIWRLTDTDGDGRADLREPLYGDFGFRDTHGMASNFLYWIDGWIYGCHGFANHSVVRDASGRTTEMNSGNTYRFRPDGSRFEIYTHGQTNPFGLAVDDWGNFYSADSHSRPVMLLLPGAHYAGIGKTHDGLGFAPTIMDHDHGSSAIAGLAWYGADHFPPEFRGNTFNGNPVTRRINRDRYEWHGSTPRAIEMPDFLTSDDPWFRPVQVKLGPDGALWIADFYTPIIGHYEQPLADPRRDHTHGRIWRIVYRGGKENVAANTDASGRVGVPPADSRVPREPSETAAADSAKGANTATDGPRETRGPAGGTPTLPIPDLTQLDAKALVEKLGDANITTRTLATNELVERVGKEAAQTVRAAVLRSENHVQIPAILWALERMQSLDAELFGAALTGDSGGTVQAAAQLLADRAAHVGGNTSFPTADDVFRILGEKVFESEPAINRASAFGLGRCPSILNILPLLMKWEAPQGDNALSHTVRIAMRDNLLHPGIYEELGKRLVGDDPQLSGSSFENPRFHEEDFARLAEVSLAVPTPNAATFLLAHLQRTKLATPRAGEYLRHAVLNLPEEKLGDVSALLQSLADAPLAQRLALADGLGQAARERSWKLPDELATWTQRTLLAALDDNALADRAIAALRDATWPEKFAPLERIVADPKRSGAVRAAALEAAINADGGLALAARALADTSSLPLRKKAAELLGDVARRSSAAPGQRATLESRAALLAALPTAPAELALAITASLAKTDADFTALLDLLEAGKASPAPLRNRLIAILVTRRADALRARADALTLDLPPEDARLDQVIAERVKTFARAKPGAAKGARIFQQHCAVCHRLRNEGGNVGPNLDGVAARGVHRLIEDILDPNRNVDPSFRVTTIETLDGQTFLGANLREQGATITLTDAAGKDVTVARANVKAQTSSRLSLMPPGFETQIAPADFHDLLAHLLGAPPAER